MNAARKRAIIVITAAACVATAGTAWGDGFFGDSITATTTGHTATVSSLSATITVDGTLYPGRSLAASAEVTNPNDFPVAITGTDRLVVTARTGQHVSPDCTTANSSVTLVTRDGIAVPAGARTHELPLTITMGRDATAACAGSVLNLTFRITAEVGTGLRPVTEFRLRAAPAYTAEARE